MQNRPALVKPKDLRDVQRDTLKLSLSVHPTRKPPRRVHNWIWFELVASGPALVAKLYPPAGMYNGHRNRDIG
jgi:hypothetical protein